MFSSASWARLAFLTVLLVVCLCSRVEAHCVRINCVTEETNVSLYFAATDRGEAHGGVTVECVRWVREAYDGEGRLPNGFFRCELKVKLPVEVIRKTAVEIANILRRSSRSGKSRIHSSRCEARVTVSPGSEEVWQMDTLTQEERSSVFQSVYGVLGTTSEGLEQQLSNRLLLLRRSRP